jgi:hypothetical protein
MEQKPIPFAVDKDGNDLFVKSNYSGIHPFVVSIDHLTIYQFGKRQTPFLKVSDCVAWHNKELRESSGKSGNKKAMDALQKALTMFRSGDLPIVEV